MNFMSSSCCHVSWDTLQYRVEVHFNMETIQFEYLGKVIFKIKQRKGRKEKGKTVHSSQERKATIPATQITTGCHKNMGIQ